MLSMVMKWVYMEMRLMRTILMRMMRKILMRIMRNEE